MGDLLLLSHRIPYPPDKGDKIRAWHVLRHLGRSHRVHVGCLIDDPDDWAHVEELRHHCASLACFALNKRLRTGCAVLGLRPGRPLTLDYFSHRGLRSWVTKKLGGHQFTGVWATSSSMAPYVTNAGVTTVVLDMCDVDSAKFAEYARRAAWPKSAVWAREGRTLLAYERKAAAAADKTLFVTEQEWMKFAELAPECTGKSGWMENGVDLDHFSPSTAGASPYPTGRHLAFTGTMGYRPNIDAVAWFAREVMPVLAGAAEFWIVGSSPGPEVRALASLPGVHVTGRVPDTRPYIGHAEAIVVPLRIARGIQNKVLEAMAMARPVIASPGAFAGVRAVAGRDVLVADGAEATAQAVREVLDGRWAELGRAARQAVESHYDWAATLRPLDALFPPDASPNGAVA